MTATAPRVRILGIDPGLRITGFGIIDKTGNTLVYVTSGCIKTRAEDGLAQRLKTILDGLGEVIPNRRCCSGRRVARRSVRLSYNR